MLHNLGPDWAKKTTIIFVAARRSCIGARGSGEQGRVGVRGGRQVAAASLHHSNSEREKKINNNDKKKGCLCCASVAERELYVHTLFTRACTYQSRRSAKQEGGEGRAAGGEVT